MDKTINKAGLTMDETIKKAEVTMAEIFNLSPVLRNAVFPDYAILQSLEKNYRGNYQKLPLRKELLSIGGLLKTQVQR